ncbi:MAG: DUF362 domain-containing protein [Candidatus Zipacnadales bacterium]
MGSIDRRDFIGTVTAAGVGVVTLGGLSYSVGAQPDNGRARVIRVRRDGAINDADQTDAALIKNMVDQSVAKLCGKNSAAEAWKSLFGADDVVTVKINCLFGRGACTHVEVTDAVVAGLLTAGVAPDNIIVWDRSAGDLLKCGYVINTDNGVKVMETGWEAEPTQSGSFNGRLATIMTDPKVTALVNVPVLKTHSISGITLAHKNHYGSFDNPNKHHGNGCDPYLTDLNALPCIRDKTRLIVADALRVVGDGGPAANAAGTWTYNGILAATDPVAIDAVGVQIIDEWRTSKGMEPIAPKAHFLQTSERAGLGIADLRKIDVIDL